MVVQRQVLVIQKAQITVDVPLLQYSDTTVTDPVVKGRREDTTGKAQELHDEVQRNPDAQEDVFSMAQGREQRAECLRQ